jgi:hypothetical protein
MKVYKIGNNALVKHVYSVLVYLSSLGSLGSSLQTIYILSLYRILEQEFGLTEEANRLIE